MSSDLQTFLLGAGLTLAVTLIVVRGIYYPATKEKSFAFSYLAFSAVIYFVLQFLTSVELSVGFGFGLFAIFSVLRYRTDEMPIREMTYLFTVIGLAVMNSFLGSVDDLTKLLIANGAVVGLLFVLERGWGFRFETSLPLVYERIDLVTPANRDALLEDLRTRTGLPVSRVAIDRIDFVRDTAYLRLFYDPRLQQARATALPVITPSQTNGAIPRLERVHEA
ncbi:MAG: DUF4956 domain-containing protein [Dehalococcoidia bacterium]